MSDIIKPIETVYKGYRFRSRLEARWAVFFDALELQWQYEPEGYQLLSRKYLPDFWLPESHDIIEIKNESMHWSFNDGILDDSAFLVSELSNLPSVRHTYIFFGDPYFNLSNDGFGFSESSSYTISIKNIGSFNSRLVKTDLLKIAALKARQARFEHGETP